MRKKLYISIIFCLVRGFPAVAYCSLSVKVENPHGGLVETRVIVEEQNGVKTEQMTTREPSRFCGLGITPVSIIVGRDGCNQVIVRKVPLSWDETRHLSIIYDEAPCQVDVPPVAACAILLRVVAVNHGPLGKVLFKAQKPFPASYNADEYGRIFVRVAAGLELSGVISATGYQPAEIRIPCISKNYRVEERIVLEK